MRKNEIIKATLITALLISTTLAILAIPATSAYTYPDMEYKYASAGDILHGVLVGAMGWYANGAPGQYIATMHSIQRSAIWPDRYTGDMSYIFQTGNYIHSGSTSAEQIITSVDYSETTWCYTYCTSHFTNAVLGGDWIQGVATAIYAS